MSLSGTCPSCRNTLALPEATLNDALSRSGSSPYECRCGVSLVARALPPMGEIELQCDQCGTQYVVDRQGAGEILDCRCGATNVVPNVLFVPPEPPTERDLPPPQSATSSQLSDALPNQEPSLEGSVETRSGRDAPSRFSARKLHLSFDTIRWTSKQGRHTRVLPEETPTTTSSPAYQSTTLPFENEVIRWTSKQGRQIPDLPEDEPTTTASPTYQSTTLPFENEVIRWTSKQGRQTPELPEDEPTTTSSPTYQSTTLPFENEVIRWTSKQGRQTPDLPEDEPTTTSSPAYQSTTLPFENEVIRWTSKQGRQTPNLPEDKPTTTASPAYQSTTLNLENEVIRWTSKQGRQTRVLPEETPTTTSSPTYQSTTLPFENEVIRWTSKQGRQTPNLPEDEPTTTSSPTYQSTTLPFENEVIRWTSKQGRQTPNLPEDEPTTTSSPTYQSTKLPFENEVIRWTSKHGRHTRVLPEETPTTTSSPAYQSTTLPFENEVIRWTSRRGRLLESNLSANGPEDMTSPEMASPYCAPVYSGTEIRFQKHPLRWSSTQGRQASRETPPETATQAPEADSTTNVHCPGCRQTYRVPISVLGQSVKCRCGSVFVLTANSSATDLALQSDLVPSQPLAIDRTDRTASPAGDPATRSPAPRPSAKPDERETAPSKRRDEEVTLTRSGIAWRVLLSLAAVLIIMTSSSWWHSRGASDIAVDNSFAQSLTDRRARPIPTKARSSAEPLPSVAPSLLVGNEGEDARVVARTHEQPAAGTSDPVDKAGSNPNLVPLRTVASKLMSEPSLKRDQLHQFARAVEGLGKEHPEFSVQELFWIGKTWEQLGERANTHELANKCFWQSAAAYALAKTVDSIAPAQMQVAADRHAELSERSQRPLQIAERPEETRIP